MLPSWVPGRTLYHLHALGAAGGGDLDAVTAWLDRVADVGCGGVLLTPIHAASTHGYDTVDPFRVDDRDRLCCLLHTPAQPLLEHLATSNFERMEAPG